MLHRSLLFSVRCLEAIRGGGDAYEVSRKKNEKSKVVTEKSKVVTENKPGCPGKSDKINNNDRFSMCE